ncbi:MAG: ferrous iron transporter B [Gammaproteobacteria bacterium]|nr:ferrous iron transporter B [Gammaproteobacteria bacterium]MBU0787904.1 ferrous iron transporter B [Gammaproteobacteria bacterium]MBU0816979.1 ferrous iron transporter B [Gammaproteobacteria bacterium]MBU1787143.1 ferrous iron transporter B [Gammaproteobacteria bacterium]
MHRGGLAVNQSLARQPWRVALVGNPNCGKTALFNLLTGARQKVANYAGVTVERKEGLSRLADGTSVTVVDLPGTYSLTPATPDEQITLEVVMGKREGEVEPDLIVAVVDATNLLMNLRLVLELKALGRPLMLAINMADVARARGLAIDTAQLSRELGVPVVETVAIRRNGHAALLTQLQAFRDSQGAAAAEQPMAAEPQELSPVFLQREVRRILSLVATQPAVRSERFDHRIDAVVMHPVWGLLLLTALLFLVFQAVFSWANVPMEAIKSLMGAAGEWVHSSMAAGPLRSLLVDGVIAGAGGVLVFLPQILILFFFILLLEDSGYLPRAAFLLDNVMGKVGLSGRAFIPLLSSFACAIPGIMATRTISNWRDRLATIMIAPLMTCSARLPVYALLIGAFVPVRAIGPFNLQGLTLFGLYFAGVLSAMAVAWLFKRIWRKSSYQPLMLELPPYRMPSPRNLVLGLWERARIFMRRVGTIIFSLTVLLWFLASYPAPPLGAVGPAIQYSAAGWLGQFLQPLFAPIGFNWQISIALVPGLAAREVAVGALGTVYAMSGSGEDVADKLLPMIAQQWSLATGYALIAWYVFAPQCLSTLAVVKRETNSWRYPLIMAAYLFALAYLAAFVTFRVTQWLGG